MVSTYRLNGLDLDVEESMSLGGVERLIDQLHADFGSGFLVTLAPVATALNGGGNLSGFSYDSSTATGPAHRLVQRPVLLRLGLAGATSGYDAIINHGVVPADKVVAGTLTNPPLRQRLRHPSTLDSTLGALTAKYPSFGGVAGWEYFISVPDGTGAPWQWASEVSAAMN